MILKYSNWSLFHKLMLIFSINFILFFLFFFFYLLPQYENVMLIEKKQGLKYNVEMIHNLLHEYQHRADSGEFTLEEAQKRALERIKTMRYQDGKNYFWVNDDKPTMIMHPTNQKLNGTDLSENKDPNGKKLFVEMVDVCKKDGEGYVFYQWAKVNETKPTDKVSYVKLFRDWGWIIGTGIWIDQHDVAIQKEIDSIYLYSFIFIAIIILVVIIIAVRFSSKLSSQIKSLTYIAHQIAHGNVADHL